MARWVECLAENVSEGTSWTACAGGGGSSPYTPLASGRIKKLIVVNGGGAATSLVDHNQFRLSSGEWPIDVVIGHTGTGLRTAPAFEVPATKYEVDLPIKAGVPIVIEARTTSAETEVTVSVLLYAEIEG